MTMPCRLQTRSTGTPAGGPLRRQPPLRGIAFAPTYDGAEVVAGDRPLALLPFPLLVRSEGAPLGPANALAAKSARCAPFAARSLALSQPLLAAPPFPSQPQRSDLLSLLSSAKSRSRRLTFLDADQGGGGLWFLLVGGILVLLETPNLLAGVDGREVELRER